MPFSPLPATFIDDLDARAGRGVMELGCGHGLFTGVLRELGVEPTTLDRAGPAQGIRPRVVGDVLQPPVRGRFGVVVAANLLRHVWPRVRSGGPRAWRDLVAPGGCLWILEDEPCDEPAPARHYRRLQELLAALQPGRRGVLLSRTDFARARDAWRWPGRWATGGGENTWPAAPARVVAMLAEGAPRPGGEVDALMRAITRDGLAYGRYWWTRWQPEVGR